MLDIARLQRICDASGISGFEDEVLKTIKDEYHGSGTFREDSLRNLYLAPLHNSDDQPTVLLDAHADEVGFMVKCIRDDGMLEFIPIGGWVASNVPAHMVRVRTKDGAYIPGIIGSKPPHYQSEQERKNPPDISGMYIDIGSASKEETLARFKVGVGSPVVPEAMCTFNAETKMLFGKAFDCRLGCSSILDTIENLEGSKLQVNIVAGFASQEEVGCRGAILTARSVQPSVAICFEGSPADDTFLPKYQQQTIVGKGPMLRHFDSKMITNPRFQEFALDVARKEGIPVQEGVRNGGATNASALHLSGEGIPTIVLGIPVRYAHTHWGVANAKDVEATIKLASAIIKALDASVIASF